MSWEILVLLMFMLVVVGIVTGILMLLCGLDTRLKEIAELLKTLSKGEK